MIIHKLWDLESIKSNDDVHESFKNKIFGGKLFSQAPLEARSQPLPSNINICSSRFKCQLKQLRKEPEVLDEYDSIIKEQLNSGVIEESSQIRRNREGSLFIPSCGYSKGRRNYEIANCLQCFLERREKRDLLK